MCYSKIERTLLVFKFMLSYVIMMCRAVTNQKVVGLILQTKKSTCIHMTICVMKVCTHVVNYNIVVRIHSFSPLTLAPDGLKGQILYSFCPLAGLAKLFGEF